GAGMEPRRGAAAAEDEPGERETDQAHGPGHRTARPTRRDHDDSLGSMTVSTTVRAHSSRATPSIGRAPAPSTGGRGTSIEPSWDFTMLRGYSRLRRITRDSGRSTGAKRTLRPAIVTSEMPACPAQARELGTTRTR